MKAGTECQLCELGCEAPRPDGCTHPCVKPCHPPPCPPCHMMIRMRCHCQTLVKHIECDRWNAASEALRDTLKSCGQACPKEVSSVILAVLTLSILFTFLPFFYLSDKTKCKMREGVWWPVWMKKFCLLPYVIKKMDDCDDVSVFFYFRFFFVEVYITWTHGHRIIRKRQ